MIKFELPISSTIFGFLGAVVSLLLPSTHLRRMGEKSRRVAIELYIMSSTALLVYLFWRSLAHPPFRGWVGFVITLFIFFRLAEMLFAGLDLLTEKITIDPATAAAMVVIYLVQTLIGFTLLAEMYGSFLNADKAPDDPYGYLFMIWGYVSTIGSSYSPQNPQSIFIAIFAGAYSLLLLGVFLAYAIGRISGNESPTGK